MEIETIASEGCRAYVISDSESREAVVIDPKLDAISEVLDLVLEKRLSVRYVFDTHTHADHISACRVLAKRLNAIPVMSHRSLCQHSGLSVRDGDSIVFGSLRLQVIETPGHTADSVCVRLADALFTGDTLLINSVGRTDLPTGDAQALFHSLFDRLVHLPPTTRVFPGHAYGDVSTTTIGEQFARNPYLRTHDLRQFVSMSNGRKMMRPTRFLEALKANTDGLVKPS